jgi:hypothetical protein
MHGFFADDAIHVQLNNKFSVLATDTLEVTLESPGLLKHKCREVIKNKRKLLLLGSRHGRETGLMF